MSDLQIILSVIGALIILAVIIGNWWQERRFHQQLESNFSSLKSDALLDEPAFDTTDLYDATVEPSLGGLAYANALPAAQFSVNDWADDSLPEDTIAEDPFIKSTPSQAIGEDISIDDAYAPSADLQSTDSQNADAIDDQRDKTQAESELEAKSAQHDNIKAIFDAAFKHKNATIANDQCDDELVSDAAMPAHVPVPDVLQESAASLPAMLDEQIDLSALLHLPDATEVSQLAAALAGLLDGYDKPVLVHVLDTKQAWHLLHEAVPDQLVSRVACSMQLADRAGPVSRTALQRFQLAVETAGSDMNAQVEWQNSGDAMTAATALDMFCIEVDKTIGFHLAHGEHGAFTGTKLRGLAEAQGLTLAADGVFKYFDTAADKAKPQAAFVMFNRDEHAFSPDMLRASVVKGVTFQLDIPHVKHGAEAFSQMVQVARKMEIGLNAVLVDDNNKVLGDLQIEKVRQQLKVIHASMLLRGIVPGTDSAHRLFS